VVAVSQNNRNGFVIVSGVDYPAKTNSRAYTELTSVTVTEMATATAAAESKTCSSTLINIQPLHAVATNRMMTAAIDIEHA